MSTPNSHVWRFFRAGGFDQARVDSAADFANLGALDQKLWAVLACPVKGLEFDERTLSLIDDDGDGRVRALEIIAAAKWCDERLNDLGTLKAGSDSVSLSQIKATTAGGKSVLASARRILSDLGKADAGAISLADVSDTAAIFATTRFNGDGIVPPGSSSDEAVQAVIAEVLKCMGGLPDRSGADGVDQAKVDAFFEQCASYVTWATKPDADSAIKPLGEATGAASAALAAVRAKVDDYFARCKLAAFDSRAVAAVNRQEAEYLAIAAADMTITAQEVAGFPIAKAEPGKALPLVAGVNPAWESALNALRSAVVEPLLGADQASLTEAEWLGLCAKLAAFDAWAAAKPATQVEALGLERLQAVLAGDSKAAITELIAQDKALEAEVMAIAEVERLVRYHRDLYRLTQNFVNLGDFYNPDLEATFQAGTLYLDGRACRLTIKVADAGKHAALAGLSQTYLAYCDCTRKSGEKMTIAVAITDGDSDFLMVGRNGIFYDRKGVDWDATVTKVIDNPISVRQAFWSPYKKLVRMVEELVAKRAAAAEAESDKKVAAGATSVANVDKTAAAAEPKKVDVGTVAALGVAVGAIGAFATALIGYLAGLFTMPFWIIVLVLCGAVMLISGPSMLVAWLKLRQRNLGPMLDANGWAINGRAKLSVPFGKSMTDVAMLPAVASAQADPFSEKPSSLPKLLMFVVIVAFFYSLLNHFGLIYTGLEMAGVHNPPIGRNLAVEPVEPLMPESAPAAEPAPAP